MFPEGEGIPPKLFQALKECEEQERRNREGKAVETLYGLLTHGSTAAKQRALPVGTSAQTARAVGRPGVQYPPLASSSTAPSNGGVVDPSPIDAMQDILQTVGECLPGELVILDTGDVLLNRLLVGLQNDTSNRLDAAAKALSAAHKQTQSATEAEQLTTKQLRSAITQYQLTLDRYKELVSCIG
jgi:hypothetical protein